MTVVIWHQVGLDEIHLSAQQILDNLALEVAAAANPPVDTGFLRNSVYIESDRVSTFDQTWISDYYHSPKQDRLVQRERVDAPERPPDADSVIVGWAAVYAWYVEDYTSFIYSALMSLAGAEDRGPLNLSGRNFVSPHGPAATAQGDSYIDRSNPNFVSPSGPAGGGGSDGIDRGARTFVAP